MNIIEDGKKRVVIFCFNGTEYGPVVRKEMEVLGFSVMMYYENAAPEVIMAAIEQLHPVDNLDVGFVVVYHKKMGKKIAPFKKECEGKKVVFVSTNASK